MLIAGASGAEAVRGHHQVPEGERRIIEHHTALISPVLRGLPDTRQADTDLIPQLQLKDERGRLQLSLRRLLDSGIACYIFRAEWKGHAAFLILSMSEIYTHLNFRFLFLFSQFFHNILRNILFIKLHDMFIKSLIYKLILYRYIILIKSIFLKILRLNFL